MKVLKRVARWVSTDGVFLASAGIAGYYAVQHYSENFSAFIWAAGFSLVVFGFWVERMITDKRIAEYEFIINSLYPEHKPLHSDKSPAKFKIIKTNYKD